MTCEYCQQQFTARANARTCSTKCRVALHRQSRPPKQLTDIDRWVRWNSAKVPMRATGFGSASSTNEETWASYVVAAKSRVGVGVGFVLAGDGITCVDIDHCFVDGVLTSWAVDVLDGLPDTFVEVSPSGDGLHVWGLAHVGQGRRLDRVEIYDRHRYITVTNNVFDGAPKRLADIQAWVDNLLERA